MTKDNKGMEIQNISLSDKSPLVVILGPCVIESKEHTLDCAFALKEMCKELPCQLIFSASYDKANRTSHLSPRGPGLNEGLAILKEVKEKTSLPISTDIHHPDEAAEAAEVCDILQIPAFLCRQTDLLIAAGKTGKTINVKKGQFLAPWDVSPIINKITSTGNHQVILTERGTSFGYNQLVFDPRSIPIMKQTGFPVCFDASHSVQLPGGLGTSSGGKREFIPHLTKAAIAAGADLIYLECHPDPQNAHSDKETVLPFAKLPSFLHEIIALYSFVKEKKMAAL
jgi:2-dehydro-3-deoxyphosphooctonate aldolase (KDO 8-P synthase)